MTIKKTAASMILIMFAIGMAYCTNHAKRQFTNPVLAGFYPDPSICRVNQDYYLVNSTFAYFPGIPVFHSKDLVHWELIGHVLDRPGQLDTQGMGLSRGIFAPAIAYHDGLFYVTCTVVDGGGNFVVTSEQPGGPYSMPVWLPEINGIDPSLYFDDNGKAYVLYNSEAPDSRPLYDGHRTIRMYEFDIDSMKITGDEMLLVNGGSDLSKKPVWIEGPHIYHRFGYYYLMAAEGGTAEDHSEVVFRSRHIEGPYEPYQNNPILTQRHLDPGREFPITSTGHADLVSTPSGEWWAVFLGCRPYRPFEKGHYNTGRETFLAPVQWIEDPGPDGAKWPVINPDYEEVQYYYDCPDICVSEKNPSVPYSGNFKVRYDFDDESLHGNFIFLRTPKDKWVALEQGYAVMQLRPESCSGTGNPSFLGHRQQHLNCTAATSLLFDPSGENEKAGLLIFLNETHYYFLCRSLENNEPVIQLYQGIEAENPANSMESVTSVKISKEQAARPLHLRIQAAGPDYSFFYAIDDSEWVPLAEKLDGTYLRAVIPRDFIGCVFAMYATSLGGQGGNTARFDWFEYQGNDEVYHQ